MKPLPETNYILGYDTDVIRLSATAYDAKGTVIETPLSAISFYANAVKLEGETFLLNREGRFKLTGQFAGKISDSLEIQVWNPASLSLWLSLINELDTGFYADGADTLGFRIDVMCKSNVLRGSFIFVDGECIEFEKSFSTHVPEFINSKQRD